MVVPVSYLWRFALGVLLGYYSTLFVAAIVTFCVLCYRVPQIIKLIRGIELDPVIGAWFASKAASFLIPLWVTIAILDGGQMVAAIKETVDFGFLNVFIREH